MARDAAGAGAEHKGFTRSGGLQPSARRVRIGVADKENGLPLIPNHAQGEIVRRRVFAHHAGSNDKNPPAAQFHFFRLAFFQDNEFQRFVQLQIRVLAVRAVRLQIIDFREHAPQAADVNRLGLQFPRAHQQRQQRQHFLRAPQRERRDQHATFAFERVMNGRDQPFDFTFARKSRRRDPVAAGGFHDQHVGLHVFKPRRAQESSGRGSKHRRYKTASPFCRE